MQAHPSSAPVNVNSPAGKADQRYSEVEANAGKSLDKDDVILSGNLEQLSQQLQSATAMFNSQSAPSTSRSQAHGGLGENGHGPGQYLLTPVCCVHGPTGDVAETLCALKGDGR